MATVRFVQMQKMSLAGSGAAIGDTTITLQSMLGIDGVAITTTDIGTGGYGTLEPGNGSNEEAITFTGITQNANGTATLTGVSHVLFISPYTASSGITKTHAGASTFILSNDAAFYGNILSYVDSSLSSGAIPATNLVAGIAKLSVAAASGSNPIVIGVNNTLSSGAISLSNPVVDVNALSTTAASGAVVRASLTTGLISSTFLSTSTPSPTIQTFTSSGTWTKPAGVKKIIVECVGSGGTGGIGAGSTTGGGGGGGGGYSRKIIDVSAVSTVAVTLSSGTTTFTGYNSASPGATGGTNAAGGGGGVGSNGDVNISGQGGGQAQQGTTNVSNGGPGGSSVLGGGAPGVINAEVGINGGNYGGGGSGTGVGLTAGTGAGGICIVTEFYS